MIFDQAGCASQPSAPMCARSQADHDLARLGREVESPQGERGRPRHREPAGRDRAGRSGPRRRRTRNDRGAGGTPQSRRNPSRAGTSVSVSLNDFARRRELRQRLRAHGERQRQAPALGRRGGAGPPSPHGLPPSVHGAAVDAPPRPKRVMMSVGCRVDGSPSGNFTRDEIAVVAVRIHARAREGAKLAAESDMSSLDRSLHRARRKRLASVQSSAVEFRILVGRAQTPWPRMPAGRIDEGHAVGPVLHDRFKRGRTARSRSRTRRRRSPSMLERGCTSKPTCPPHMACRPGASRCPYETNTTATVAADHG